MEVSNSNKENEVDLPEWELDPIDEHVSPETSHTNEDETTSKMSYGLQVMRRTNFRPSMYSRSQISNSTQTTQHPMPESMTSSQYRELVKSTLHTPKKALVLPLTLCSTSKRPTPNTVESTPSKKLKVTVKKEKEISNDHEECIPPTSDAEAENRLLKEEYTCLKKKLRSVELAVQGGLTEDQLQSKNPLSPSSQKLHLDKLKAKLEQRNEQHQLDKVKLMSLEQHNELLKLKCSTLESRLHKYKHERNRDQTKQIEELKKTNENLQTRIALFEKDRDQAKQKISILDKRILEVSSEKEQIIQQHEALLEQHRLQEEDLEKRDREDDIFDQIQRRNEEVIERLNETIENLELELVESRRLRSHEREIANKLELTNHQLWTTIHDLERQLEQYSVTASTQLSIVPSSQPHQERLVENTSKNNQAMSRLNDMMEEIQPTIEPRNNPSTIETTYPTCTQLEAQLESILRPSTKEDELIEREEESQQVNEQEADEEEERLQRLQELFLRTYQELKRARGDQLTQDMDSFVFALTQTK